MLTTQNPNPNEKQAFVLWRPFLAVWTWLVPPTQAHIDRQSRTARLVFLGLIVMIAVALVVTAIFKGRDWHNAYKRWLSDRDAEQAVKYENEAVEYQKADRRMESQDATANAIRSANAAWTNDSDNPNAIRVLARLTTRMGKPEARFFWDKLDQAHQLTDDDFGWRIQALANLKEDKTASDQIERLLRDSAPTKNVVHTADQVMQHLGRVRQLLAILRDYVKKQPDDHDTQLLLGLRLMQLGNEQEQKEGRDIIWEVSNRDDDTGLNALHLLDKLKTLTVDEQHRLIDRLQHHPEAKEADRIAALHRMADLPGADKEAIIDKALADHATAGRQDLVPLSQWLLSEGEYQKLADFLKPKEDLWRNYSDMPGEVQLLDDYLNALTHLKMYAEVQRLVDDPKIRMRKFVRAFHRAHLAYVLGKPEDELNKLLIDAVAVASSDHEFGSLLLLGQYAEQRKMYRIALDAYRAATGSAATEREGYDSMMRVDYLVGDTKEFSEAAGESSRRWPDNHRYQQLSLYAGLLTGFEMETAIARCQKLYDASPGDSQYKLIMGLAYIRMADPQSCQRVLNQINLDEITPGQRAVLCGLIRAVGKTRQASELAQTIPDGIPMLPEEANFLRRARQSPDVANALK